ncbi:J domain-containing protein [Candidatus Pelagibacter bacterium nBUS_44]|uniref:J domain-containing protein n=1 Tax=Candidatus Pelagibacter bacterium nBUS_44 TaxID=3374195 RepID=UPI003EB8DFD6
MNIIIYTVLFLISLYFLLKFFANIASKKISQGLRLFLFVGLVILAILFAVGGKFLLSLPLTIISLALLKLKGLSLFQLISLFRLIQTLRNSQRFSFKNKNAVNNSSMSVSEAYKILNLDPSKTLTKNEINKAYIRIQKKIHPDISPETARLSSIVNEAKDILLNNLS